VFLWDTELPGFGCKITPKGRRIYVLQYSQAGRDRRITIGRHGIDLTAEQARGKAVRLRGLIAIGETPTGQATQRAEVITVAELGQRYLDEYAIPHKKPSGIAQDRRNLQNHVVPLMGKLRISAVERADVARVMREVAAGKTAKDEKTKHQGRRIVRGGEIVANRVQALLSKMFALAEDWKLVPREAIPAVGLNDTPNIRWRDFSLPTSWPGLMPRSRLRRRELSRYDHPREHGGGGHRPVQGRHR
jgi:hypothetical protein